MPLGMIRGEGQGGGWAAGRAGRGELGDGQGKRGGCFVSRERIKNGPGWSSVGCRRLDCRPL